MSVKDSLPDQDQIADRIGNKSMEAPSVSPEITIPRETEKRFRELNHAFDHAEAMASLGTWQLKLNADKLFFSNNFYHILGCEPNEFAPLYENFLDFVHDEDKDKVMTKHQMLVSNSEAYSSQYRIRRKNGQVRYLKSVNKLSVIDDEKIMFGTVQDVTEEFTLRRQLEEKISLAESLIENSVDLIAAYDLNQRCIAWNKACEICFQKKKEDVLCKHVNEIFPELIGFACMNDLASALKGEYRYRTDQILSNVEGFYEYYIIPLKNTNGEVFGAVSISHDLNAMKKSSAELNQLNQSLEQKNQELERSNDELAAFSYIASHDLQEPLRKIQTFSKIIIEREFSALSAKGKDYLERMESGASRMQALIDDLLAFSQTSTYPRNFAQADLNDLLDEVKLELRDLIEEKNAFIESAHLPVVKVISFQFRQLMENLIINAIKYSKPNTQPHVKITSEIASASEINNSQAIADKTYYKISVTDRGIGFEQEYAQRIFELFQRLHGKDEYPGTGLGLAICKKIVQNHRGFITAKGEPGVGATFIVYLP